MKLRRFASLLLVVVLLSSMAVFGTSAADTEQQATGAYSNMGKYSNMTYNGTDLGANYTKAKTTFKVWSPEATKIEVKLYRTGSDREKGAGVIGTFPMTKGSSGVWSYDYAGDHKNEYYTYLVTAKNIYGSVATLETQDIYSKAVGVNGERSMIVDLDSTDPEGWADDQHVVFDNSCQSNVYELHVRDFSADPDCGVSEANQGNFLAFTEGGTTYKKQGKLSTCIDYLVENNIRTVQLMPIADFTSVDEVYSDSADIRNWGYDPKNYNVPDGVYSSNAYDGNVRIKECKQMIQALHDRGISVIMDVVYNHTSGYESTAFSRIVPGYYYRMSGNGYVDGTGCGCEFATENAMVRNFIVQSLAYWADEYHMDGFRFDLMACIDVDTLNAARTKLNSLFKGAEKMPMYGEPWTGGSSACTKQANKTNVGSLKTGIGLFSADMRDAGTNIEKTTTQGWVGGNTASTATVVSGIKGDLIQSSDNTKEVNYAECHDKYTVWDKLVGAKMLSDQPQGKDSKTSATNVNSTSAGYISQLKLTAALFMTSQGIKFMQGGTEFARTKQGQDNSYNSGDKINMLDWKRAQTYSNSVAYYKGLRQIQEVYTPFNDDTNKSKGKISMKSSSGSLIAYTIDNTTANASKEWGTVAVILNNGSSQATANLGASGWKVVANDTQAGVTALSDVSGSSYSVPGKSAAILVKADGYKDLSDRFKYGTLTTKHIVNGKEYKTVTAKYRIGTKYRALKDEELLIRNNVTSTEGTPTGTFSGDTTVTFNYESNGKTMGTIKVNYLDQAKKEVVPGMSYILEKGEAYNIPVGSVQGYQLDTDKYPLNTYGKFSGQDTTITFTYKPLDVKQTVVHYKNTSKYSVVYCYAYTDDGKEPLGAWSYGKSSKGLMTSEGNNWYKITIPIASCRLLFHGSQNEGQEPGNLEPGYPVSGEAKIDSRVVTSENTLIVSHIDIDTGKKLKEAVQEKGVKSITDKYTTKEDTSCGRLVATPYNASGTFSSGAINVVYLYRNGADPTEPPTDAPTEPPTQAPTDAPTNAPTDAPSDGPTGTPTDAPTQAPTTDTAPATSGDSSLLGDSNCDTLIDVRDVTFIQQYLVNLAFFEEKNLRNSDVDGNGKITIKDASYIQRYLVKIDVPFKIGQPVETPAPTAAPADTPTAAPADAPTAAPTAAPGQEVTETPTDAPGPDPTVAPEPDTEPETDPEPETDAPVPDKQQIVFTNNYGWSGDLTCHYWLGEQTFTEWPGEAMTNAGPNDYGEEQWSIELPVGCSFVITNGEVQTTDLTFTGSEVGFYPLKDSADAPPTTDAEGHYECGSY